MESTILTVALPNGDAACVFTNNSVSLRYIGHGAQLKSSSLAPVCSPAVLLPLETILCIATHTW